MKKKMIIKYLLMICCFLQSCNVTPTITVLNATDSAKQTVAVTSTKEIIITGSACMDISDDFVNNRFIGLIVPPYPCGIKARGGFFVDPFSKPHSLDWAVNLVSIEKDNMLWLEKKVNENQWQVFDFLVLPPYKDDWSIVPDLCSQNGEEDPKIFVIALIDEETRNTRVIKNENIIQSWKIDLSSGKFINIENEGVKCYADQAFRP